MEITITHQGLYKYFKANPTKLFVAVTPCHCPVAMFIKSKHRLSKLEVGHAGISYELPDDDVTLHKGINGWLSHFIKWIDSGKCPIKGNVDHLCDERTVTGQQVLDILRELKAAYKKLGRQMPPVVLKV